MASFRFVGPPSPSVYQPPSPSLHQPHAAPKLRDSCDACASSKVKCHKEKPTCSRCSKRGVKCIYVSAKRGNRGRKPALGGGSNTASKSSSAAPPPPHSQPESGSRSPETASSLTTPNNGAGMGDDGGDMIIDPQLMNDWFSADPHGMDFLETPLGHSGTTDVSPVDLNLTAGSTMDLFTSFLNGEKSLSPFGSTDLGSMVVGDGSMSTTLGDGNLFGEPFTSPIPFSLLPSSVDTEMLSSHNTDQLAPGGSEGVVDIMNLDVNSDQGSSSASKGKEKNEEVSDPTALRLDTNIKTIQTAADDAVDLPPSGEALPGDFHETCMGGNSSCSCMVRALGLLSKVLIFPPLSTASTRASTGTTTPETLSKTSLPENLPTLQKVMEANGQAVESLSALMQLPCACSQNGYLLVIVSTIVFKILAWYAVVANRTDEYSALDSCLSSIDLPATLTSSSSNTCSSTSSGQHHPIRRSRFSNGLASMDVPKTVDNYSVRGDDSNRMAAQQVLSELHRVHRLVGLWSAKLRMKKEEKYFSAGLLQHAEAGMKKKLKQLSMGIVEYLSHS